MAHNRGIKDPFSRKGGVPVSGADGRVPPRGSRGKMGISGRLVGATAPVHWSLNNPYLT